MKDLEIVYQNGKPYGIRNKKGYLFFFTKIEKYMRQNKRYKKELFDQINLAEYLLAQLKKL